MTSSIERSKENILLDQTKVNNKNWCSNEKIGFYSQYIHWTLFILFGDYCIIFFFL